jgi:FMN phosphatase YigB (HAD superfamily)
MSEPADVVFLLDVDNTLLDNDRVAADLDGELRREIGAAGRDQYWEIFESLRTELGYADYLGACQRYRLGATDHLGILSVSMFLIDYPFAERLYPGALAAIAHLAAFGTTVILSDGDIVLQPLKTRRSGLWNAVDGRVLIYVHKEVMLDDVERRYPARHYVMVDDKQRLLGSMKKTLGSRLTTVFPRQGHYAQDPAQVVADAPPDVTVERIGDLVGIDLAKFLGK